MYRYHALFLVISIISYETQKLWPSTRKVRQGYLY